MAATMSTVQLTDCSNPLLLLNPFLPKSPSLRSSSPYPSSRGQRFVPVACSRSGQGGWVGRRKLVADAAVLSLALAPLEVTKADDIGLSEWERVYLDIPPGVVLLDIAFVPDDSNHGLFS